MQKSYCQFYALSLIIILFYACNNKPVTNPADAIYYNGTILTMEETQKEVAALAVKDGKIFQVGSLESVTTHQGDSTKMIDFKLI